MNEISSIFVLSFRKILVFVFNLHEASAQPSQFSNLWKLPQSTRVSPFFWLWGGQEKELQSFNQFLSIKVFLSYDSNFSLPSLVFVLDPTAEWGKLLCHRRQKLTQWKVLPFLLFRGNESDGRQITSLVDRTLMLNSSRNLLPKKPNTKELTERANKHFPLAIKHCL